ncbi:MAG: symmetrical bis(5'-nucleosyl)-tetraphosphatase [Epsilonproteobacteria bacterium]|nr:symmetrical bis(5'-nucleosyl)-tetraphosphatase [Campylobacterota bacterium]
MAIYAIGDVQGCYTPLMRLIEKIKFDPSKDKLWFVGDLVNRGKNSLEVLKFVYSLKESAITVLGNHDIRLLASYFKLKKPNDTLKPIFKDPMKNELLEWLRNRPLLHFSEDFLISHAGVYPFWDLKTAIKRAKEVEFLLQSDLAKEFLKFYYKNDIKQDKKTSNNLERASFALKAFTMMRFLQKDGELDFDLKIHPKNNFNSSLIPWFKLDKGLIKQTKVFGHWAALGLYRDLKVIAIDTGCVWGKNLTALKLQKEPQFSQIKCEQGITP